MAQPTLRPSAVGDPADVLTARTALRLLLVLAVALVVLTVAVASRWQPLMRLDHTVARTAFDSTSGHPWLVTWWRLLADVTEPIVLRALMLLAGLVMLWLGSRFLGGWLIAVALVEQLVGPYAKYLLDRPRPHWTHPLDVLSTSSYPAGHATGVACFATAVVLLALATLAEGRARAVVVGAAGLLVVLVCADRLLLGMHYLSDVAAGLLLGVMTTLACWAGALLWRARSARSATSA